MNYSNLSEIEALVNGLSRSNIYSEDPEPIFCEGAFQTINVGDFQLQINAGEYCFCSPRQNLKSISEYDTVQIRIEEFLEKSKQVAIIIPNKDERFVYFDWKKYFCFDETPTRHPASYIGTRVPLQTVYQIIKDLNKLTKLRTFL